MSYAIAGISLDICQVEWSGSDAASAQGDRRCSFDIVCKTWHFVVPVSTYTSSKHPWITSTYHGFARKSFTSILASVHMKLRFCVFTEKPFADIPASQFRHESGHASCARSFNSKHFPDIRRPIASQTERQFASPYTHSCAVDAQIDDLVRTRRRNLNGSNVHCQLLDVDNLVVCLPGGKVQC